MSTAIEPRSHRIDGAILVLIFTAIAYVAAFTYEATYLSYFGIPIEFVDVTLRELLLYGVIALACIFAAMMFSMFLWEFFLKSLPPALSKIVFIFTLMAVAATAFMLLTGNSQPAIIAGAIGPLLINCLLFVIPLFRFSHMSSYRRRLMATYAGSSPSDSFRPSSFLWLPIRNDVIPLAACTVASILLAFACGEFRARTQIEFPVLGSIDPCIVLRVSTEGYLCVAFNPQSRTELASFRFVDSRGPDIHIVKIGHLKPATAQGRRLLEEKPKAASEKPISPDHRIPPEQQ
jgi:hypothetical protein